MSNVKTEKPGVIISLKTTENLKKNRFVGFTGTYFDGGAGKALGVINADTDVDEYMPITVTGVVLVETAEAVSVSDAVTGDNWGQARKATVGTDTINGYALDSSQGEAEFIRVLLK